MKPALAHESVNFWTHFVPMLAWIPLTGILLVLAWGRIDAMVACGIYGLSATALFAASANYHHKKKAENEDSIHRKLDHIAIFFMIAGTYTPAVWIWFDDPWRLVVLALQWGVTLFGLLYNILARHRNRWIETGLYVAMGWVVVYAIKPLYDRMPGEIFLNLGLGGLAYTIGAVIYALKKPDPWPGRFGFHELFHVFIVLGALFHGNFVLGSLLEYLAR